MHRIPGIHPFIPIITGIYSTAALFITLHRHMCGLSGIFNLDGKPINTADLLKMSRTIRHRGPDDEGFLLVDTSQNSVLHCSHEETILEIRSRTPVLPQQTSSNLGIAYRRLAIIDLSPAAHQPMTDPEGQIWLCFNGEIYNYLEIRQELIALSHTFKTNSDSEVLIHAYLQWGVSCLQKFIGMFAFVIYDHRDKRLFIARDRMGVKPLNYYFKDQQFIWASEEKQIVSFIPHKLNPDTTRILEFLKWNRQLEETDTFFNEIKQLAPAHYLLIEDGKLEIKKYWAIPVPTENQLLSEQESKEQVRELLNDSITLRLRSDVPLGIALSGGIDSSSVCCLARKLTNQSIKTFSVYYEGEKYDERKYIQSVLDLGGFSSQFHTGSQEINLNDLTRWTYHQDAPTSGGSPYSAYLNYRNVRQAGIIVLLNGQGGDELFAGYPYFFKYYLAQCVANNLYKEYIQTLFGLTKSQGLKQALSHSYLAAQVLKGSPSALKILEHKKYASADLYPDSQLKFNPFQNRSLLSTALQNAIQMTHLPHMLRWEDRNSMAHSIESRVPFLDHRLVERSFYIPDHLKLHRGETKYILRQSMRGLVPDLILNRTDKIGFASPTTEWTQTNLKSAILDMAHSQEFLSRTWWNGPKIQRMLNKNSNEFAQHELWRIFTTEIWYQTFFKHSA